MQQPLRLAPRGGETLPHARTQLESHAAVAALKPVRMGLFSHTHTTLILIRLALNDIFYIFATKRIHTQPHEKNIYTLWRNDILKS